jgi:16S rRNA (cytosine967-C5)-methyltransferase
VRQSKASVDPARKVALEVLRAVGERGAYANLTLPSSIRDAGLTGRDAAFVTELTYGTLRGQGTYDAVIAKCANRPLVQVDRGVRDVLRLGAHQLFQMDVPTHAAVNTSVELARSSLGSRPSGFVNAVMRRMSARSWSDWLDTLTSSQTDPLVKLSLRHAHPLWIVQAFDEALADRSETELLLVADNKPPRVHLVVRPDRGSLDELIDRGASKMRWSPWGATWPGGDPSDIAAVREGRAGVQDEGSQLVANALAQIAIDGSDTRWLDLCAGPGGKAALLGGIARSRGARVTAVELKEHRADLVRAVVGDNVEVVTADGTSSRWATGDYDRVLVDVPCTGLGSLRRRPESRWRRAESSLEELRPIQESLLDSALRAVRPGGVVGYVTCSPALSETKDVVSAGLTNWPDARQLDAREWLPTMPGLGAGPAVQLWPHRHETDAMFLALLTRS